MIKSTKTVSDGNGKTKYILRKKATTSTYEQEESATRTQSLGQQQQRITIRAVLLRELNFDDRMLDQTEMSSRSIASMIESIKSKELIKPVIVAETPKGMILLDGRRRVEAYRELKRDAIIARIFKLESEEHISAIRMIANSFHEDLKPLDRANLIYRHFVVRHPNRSLQDIISNLITHQRHPERSEADFAATVDAVVSLSGVKIGTIKNALGLLNLPPRIQEAVKQGEIQQSKAYLMSKFHDREDLMDVFQLAVEKNLTNSALKRLLKKEADQNEVRRTHYRKMLSKFRVSIEKEVTTMGKGERDLLVADLSDLIAIISDPNRIIFSGNQTDAHQELEISGGRLVS